MSNLIITSHLLLAPELVQGAGGEASEVQAGYAFHVLQAAHEAKIFSEKQKAFRDGLSYVLHPSKKAKKCHYLSSVPSHP